MRRDQCGERSSPIPQEDFGRGGSACRQRHDIAEMLVTVQGLGGGSLRGFRAGAEGLKISLGDYHISLAVNFDGLDCRRDFWIR